MFMLHVCIRIVDVLQAFKSVLSTIPISNTSFGNSYISIVIYLISGAVTVIKKATIDMPLVT